jgi:hypothetical protein
MCGLNNAADPIVGLFLGGGSNEADRRDLRDRRHPGQPVLRVNPISAMAPGVLQDFRVRHRQAEQPVEFPPNTESVSCYGARSAGTTRNGINPSTTLTSAKTISQL